MEKSVFLTEGKISKVLLRLSLPIIATNFIQTAYGMVDMIWVGKLGSKAVASIGTASFYINLAQAVFTIIMIGSGVKIAQSLGGKRDEDAKTYIKNSLVMSLTLAIIYCTLILLFKKELISFFDLNNPEIEFMAQNYLFHSALGVVFMYFNTILSTILNSYGNSKLPFKINSIGFILNMVLDPLFIFGLGPIKGMGVTGAAITTNIGRVTVLLLFFFVLRKNIKIKEHSLSFDMQKAKEVLIMGLPVALQRITFIGISIIIAKIIADFGATAIAVQKVGVQLESESYMTIGGIQGAIAAYMGQNYGAGKFIRVRDGYSKALTLTIIFGTMISVVFLVFPKQLFQIFVNEEEALRLGISYLRILGLSQMFMCMEILTVGAFNGIGKTYVPPVVSIIFTAARIPIALILSQKALFGLDGIWLSITLSSFIKGMILVFWFSFSIKTMLKVKLQPQQA